MRRFQFVPALAVAVMLAACSQVSPLQQLAAAAHKSPLAPTDLKATTPADQPLGPKGWTNQARVKLTAVLSSPESSANLVAEAEFVPVETGITGTTDIEVTKGLQPGDEIVTGSYKVLRTLRNGAPVKVDNSAPKKEDEQSS